jgi:hypothetical protein
VAVGALIWAVAPAQATTTQVYEASGEHVLVVPAGVTSMDVLLIGGHGGAAGTSPGGAAAEVGGTIGVTPGTTLYVEVGGVGKDESAGGAGGFNGGGSGGAGGGGASDLRTMSLGSGLSPDTRLVVAAGGGGAGATGGSLGGLGGDAGEQGGEAEGGYPGGLPGTSTEGGEGTEGCFSPQGTGEDGGLGFGGDGGDSEEVTGPGGGGGGGLYGGGGGAGSCNVGSSGGGGGSSLMPLDGFFEIAAPEQEPLVELTYTLPPPSISIASPTNGAVYAQAQTVNSAYSCTAPEGTSVKTCAGPVATGALIDTSTPGPHSFTVNAEDNDGETATKTVNYTVEAKKTEESGKGGSVTPPPPPPPDTVIGSHPKGTIKTTKQKVSVRFSFSSASAGASFECRLDKGAFAPCSSPKSYKAKIGKHTFSVRALTAAGGADQSPATFTFKVKKKPNP